MSRTIPHKFYSKQKRDKRNLVPDNAVNIDGLLLEEVLTKMLFRSQLKTGNNYAPQSAQRMADKMLTHIRTIVSKAYTEVFSATTTGSVSMTDDEVREFTKWFNGVVAEGLEKAGELVIEHRELLRNMQKD